MGGFLSSRSWVISNKDKFTQYHILVNFLR